MMDRETVNILINIYLDILAQYESIRELYRCV